MEGYELGRERGTKGENVQRIRSMNGRYKIDRGKFRTVEEMEKPRTYM